MSTPLTSKLAAVAPGFSVAGQLTPEDVEALARDGVRLIINNRTPQEDLMELGSQTAARAAAEAAGIAHAHIPISGGYMPEDLDAFEAAVAEADGPVVAYCRSGSRSIMLWALAQARSGAQSVDALVAAGDRAGFNLEVHRALLESVAPPPGG